MCGIAREIDLGRSPVWRLVLTLALPTMLAQFVSVLYSIVDRMYIGHIPGCSVPALAGVGVCGPIVTLISSFASLVGLGGAPLMSISMGRGNRAQAGRILSNCLVMLLMLSGALTVGFFLGRERLLLWFGASPATVGYAERYLSIYLLGTVFALTATGLNSFVIAQGFSGLGMLTVVVGAALNIALDPIFIFTLDLGVAGAALATVLSQAASGIFVICVLRRPDMPVPLRPGRPDRRTAGRILAFGASPFLVLSIESVLLLALNATLQRWGGPGEGDSLVTCATVVQSYLLVVVLPLGGLTLGSQPVVAFNYGAGQAERVRRAVRYIVGLCVCFCALMTLITWTLCPWFVRLFTSDGEIVARCVRYIKLYTCMIIPLAVQYPLVDESVALGRVGLALFFSLFRKGLFLLCVLVFPPLAGAEAAFLAEPAADLLSALLSTCLFLRRFPRILSGLETPGKG